MTLSGEANPSPFLFVLKKGASATLGSSYCPRRAISEDTILPRQPWGRPHRANTPHQGSCLTDRHYPSCPFYIPGKSGMIAGQSGADAAFVPAYASHLKSSFTGLPQLLGANPMIGQRPIPGRPHGKQQSMAWPCSHLVLIGEDAELQKVHNPEIAPDRTRGLSSETAALGTRAALKTKARARSTSNAVAGRT